MFVVNSPVDICNLALIYCGATTINSLTDDNPEARICNTLYYPTLGAMLRKHNWKFATKRICLSPVIGFSEPKTLSIEGTYQLPPDLIKIIRVYPDGASYKTINGNLLIIEESCLGIPQLEYIAEVKENAFDPTFVEALAYALAEKMIYKFNQSVNATNLIREQAMLTLREARYIDSTQGTMGTMLNETWIKARNNGF